jgi:hypothetical protein
MEWSRRRLRIPVWLVLLIPTLMRECVLLVRQILGGMREREEGEKEGKRGVGKRVGRGREVEGGGRTRVRWLVPIGKTPP